MGKAFEFYSLYMAKDWEGLFKLTCESVFGMTRGDALYNEILPFIEAHQKAA